MRLSKRLMMSARMVTPGSRVADVGCDHAHTSIWLIQNGIAASCIAMDLREGPLQHATENIALCNYSDRIKTRLSDGLEALSPGEADCILITGMGGKLTTDILQKGKETVDSATELVLQPQSDIGLVRRQVIDLGFTITEEACCVDYGKFYLSLHALRNGKTKAQEPYSESELAYGRYLVADRDKTYSEWLKLEAKKAKGVIKRLKSAETPGASERLTVFSHEYDLLKETLNKFK